MMNSAERNLLLWGAVLIFLGLLSGVFVRVVTNPRMGLSAHVVGVEGGMLLVVLGLAWSYASLSERQRRTTRSLLLYSPYAIWLSCLLGSVFGTSMATPIAGHGFSAALWKEVIVALGLGTGSVAALVSVGTLVFGLARAGRDG